MHSEAVTELATNERAESLTGMLSVAMRAAQAVKLWSVRGEALHVSRPDASLLRSPCEAHGGSFCGRVLKIQGLRD